MSTPEAPPNEHLAIGEIRLSGLFAKRYQIIRELAKGGMGVVYKAQDTVLDKVVALKLILYRDWSEDQLLRFQREAQASSRLLHPNIAIVYNFGLDDENNTPYMVLEFVEGKTIKKLLSKTTFSVLETLQIGSQLCAALHHAHLNGLIHRDVKSSNVILDTSANPFVAKIIDFGIARIVDAPNFKGTLTSDVIVPGSPPYMAPEQIRQQPTDQRCDIYSLGCVLFEMLTGQTPFRGDTAIETMEMHVSKPAPLLASVCNDIEFPEELEGLIAKCLAKDPSDRFQSAEDLKIELETLYSELQDEQEASAHAKVETEEEVYQEPGKDESDPGKRRRSFLVAAIALALGVLSIAVMTRFFGYLVSNDPLENSIPVPKRPLTKNKALSKETHRIGEKYLSSLEEKIDFKEIERHPNIVLLKYRNGPDGISEESMARLSKIPISGLDLAYSNIPKNGLETIGKMKNLFALKLGKTSNVTDASIKNLSGLTKLHDLSLADHPDLTGSTFSSLQALPLARLSLRACPSVTPKNLKSLSKFKYLTTLDLQGNNITKEHLQAVAKLPLLIDLALSHSHFLPGAIDVLPEIKNLKRLTIAGTDITDQDLMIIAEINGLAEIDIERSRNLSSLGIARFRRRLPQCQVLEPQLLTAPWQGRDENPLPSL